MSRNPRSTTPCRPPPSATGARQRAAEHSTVQAAGATATLPQGVCRPRTTRPVVKSSIPKRGPPPAPPRKIDYKRPQMTRTMEQRLKHTQRLQEQMERKERELAEAHASRRPRRSALCPEARPAGRERRPPEERGRSRPRSAPPAEPSCPPPAASTPAPCQQQQQPPPCCPEAQRVPSGPRRRSPAGVPARTLDLAKSINADIVKAEPLENGLIDNLIIPPGAINSEKTTVINIPQPSDRLVSSTFASHAAAGQPINNSAQVISESLDEQDATEAAFINSKLQELQQARRDFVMAVANVGGNTVNLQDETMPNFTRIGEINQPPLVDESSTPRLIPCPDLDDPYLRVEYGRHHPVVEAAREYMRSRQTERYIDEDYARVSCAPGQALGRDDELLLETGASEEDEPAERGQYTVIPRRTEAYPYLPMQVERLERFFDLRNYPAPRSPPTPPATGPRPPPGRECLPPELWELDDPWYQEAEVPDLIDWNDY